MRVYVGGKSVLTLDAAREVAAEVCAVVVHDVGNVLADEHAEIQRAAEAVLQPAILAENRAVAGETVGVLDVGVQVVVGEEAGVEGQAGVVRI